MFECRSRYRGRQNCRAGSLTPPERRLCSQRTGPRRIIGVVAPRELIHLLTSLQEVQLGKYDVGAAEPPDKNLIDRSCFKEAMVQVSRVRVEQTIYAEYPDLKPWIEELEGEKAEQTVATLTSVWEVSIEEAARRAQRLVEVGFFESFGAKNSPRFKVPFLYRDYLGLVQGKADLPGYSEPEEEERSSTSNPLR
jgi:hypothetical protein